MLVALSGILGPMSKVRPAEFGPLGFSWKAFGQLRQVEEATSTLTALAPERLAKPLPPEVEAAVRQSRTNLKRSEDAKAKARSAFNRLFRALHDPDPAWRTVLDVELVVAKEAGYPSPGALRHALRRHVKGKHRSDVVRFLTLRLKQL